MRQCLLSGDQVGVSIWSLAEGAEPIWSLDVQEDVTCCWSTDCDGIVAASTHGLLLAASPDRQQTHKSTRIANASFTDVEPWGHDFLVAGNLGVSTYSARLQRVQDVWSQRPCLQLAAQYDKQLIAGNVDGSVLLRKMDGAEEVVAADIRTRALRFSSILPIIGYGQSSGQVTVWDCGSSQVIYNKTLFPTSTTSLCFSCHSDKLLVSSCMEKMVFVDFRGHTIIKDMVVRPEAGITTIDYARDGYTIACGCRDGSLVSLDLRKYKEAVHNELRGPDELQRRVNRVVVGTLPRGNESSVLAPRGNEPSVLAPRGNEPFTPAVRTSEAPAATILRQSTESAVPVPSRPPSETSAPRQPIDTKRPPAVDTAMSPLPSPGVTPSTPSTAQLSSLMSRLSAHTQAQAQRSTTSASERGPLLPTSPEGRVLDGRRVAKNEDAPSPVNGKQRDSSNLGATILRRSKEDDGVRRGDDSSTVKPEKTLTPMRGKVPDATNGKDHSSNNGTRIWDAQAPIGRSKAQATGDSQVPHAGNGHTDIAQIIQAAVEAAVLDVRKDVQDLGFEMIAQFHTQKMELEDMVKDLRQEIHGLRVENAELRKMRQLCG